MSNTTGIYFPISIVGAPIAGVNAVQTLTIGGSPTTGALQLKSGPFVTPAYNWSATNATLVANLQAALDATPSIGAGNSLVAVGTMTAGVGTLTITMQGDLASLDVPLMTVFSNTLDGSGTAAITSTTDGVTASGRGAAPGAELVDSVSGLSYVNSGTAYAPIWTLSGDAYAFKVKADRLGSPALGTNTAVKAAIPLAAAVQTGITSGITNPDVPRNIVIKGNASGMTGNVVIHGTDKAGTVISETIALNAATAVAGAKAFKTVTSIDYPIYTNATTDTVSIGVGQLLGLSGKLNYNGMLAAYLGGAKEGTAPTIATSATSLSNNTASLNSALNGSAVIVTYINDTAD